MVQVEIKHGEKERNGRVIRMVSDPFWAIKVRVVINNNKKGILENLREMVGGKEENEYEEDFLMGERLFVVNGMDLVQAAERVKKYMEEEIKEKQIMTFEIIMGWKHDSTIAGSPVTHIVVF